MCAWGLPRLFIPDLPLTERGLNGIAGSFKIRLQDGLMLKKKVRVLMRVQGKRSAGMAWNDLHARGRIQAGSCWPRCGR